MEHSFHKLSDADKVEFDRVKVVMAENWKQYCEGIEPALLDKVLTYARKRAEFHTKEWNAGKYRD